MKFIKILPAVLALLFGAGLIAFSFIYKNVLQSEEFFKKESGVPIEFGMVSFNNEGNLKTTKTPFQFKLANNSKTFLIRVFDKNFNLPLLQTTFNNKKEIEVVYNPQANEINKFDVYKITQAGVCVYSFSQNFNSSSSKFIVWLVFFSGLIVFVLGIFSLRRRWKEA